MFSHYFIFRLKKKQKSLGVNIDQLNQFPLSNNNPVFVENTYHVDLFFLRYLSRPGIIIGLDKRSGGATVDEFRRFAVEQTRARIMTPSPIPVIWYVNFNISNYGA